MILKPLMTASKRLLLGNLAVKKYVSIAVKSFVYFGYSSILGKITDQIFYKKNSMRVIEFDLDYAGYINDVL